MRDGSKRNLILAALAAVPLLVVIAPGCEGSAGELCDLACECAPCNDREADECVIGQSASEDRAAAYGCDAEYETWIECAITDNDCDDGNFSIDDSCDDDAADLAECIEDNSDIIQGNGQQQSVGQGGNGQQQASSTGVGGSGAGTTCDSCSDFLLDTTGMVMIEDVCGFDANSATGCNTNPQSSCNLAAAVALCTCGDAMTTGACEVECQLSCTGSGMDTNCMTCSTTACSAETNACLADPGTT